MRFLYLAFLLSALPAFSQLTQPPFTPATERIKSFEQRQELRKTSLVGGIPFTNIGPTVCSGRVADLEVNPADPTEFYVAYASGGLWHTTNNGTSFSPIFDDEMVMTIGDIAVDWNSRTLWVGTGEVNSSRSSYSGTGVYKSADNGKTWSHLGLGESHHIGRILLHPQQPQTAWVAVLGHLYSPNQERGVYLTTDGGKTWTRTLFVNDDTGVVDLVMDPANPDVLYAAAWERTRRAWDFVESGKGSGIYKSTDGGKTWSLLSGFPAGEGIGRIGLAISGKTLYAVLDNYFRRPADKPKAEEGLTKEQLRSISRTDFLALDPKLVEAYLRKNNFPEKYTAEKVMDLVKTDQIQPIALVEYTEDANSLLFDTPVVGAEVYRSTDGGRTWKKTHEEYLDEIFFSYGYYFGQIRAHATMPDQIYILGVPIMASADGGKTWKSIMGDNVHADHHALWVNPAKPDHLILGNDGGVNISYDRGTTWIKCNTPAVGQFYTVAVDQAKPFNVYGGLQDNGVWKGPSTYQASTEWHGSGQYPYKELIGGDGMQVAIDPRDNTTVYTGYQFGNYYRINPSQGDFTYITPKHELGDRPLRWNWQSPIWLSVHNPDILYMGSNKVHRSLNRGNDFEEISPDLTTGGKKGDVAFSTLTTLHESPLQFGLLYAGSDDGLVHVSRDGGHSWTNISRGLPEHYWVSRVQASAHEKGRVYVTLNGYRWDDFTPFVFVSEDYGQTWTRLGRDLPLEPVNVLREDPAKPDILYLGTDHGLYVSLDRGQSFMAMYRDLPAVAVHDLAIHAASKTLVVGTHGRSLYKASIGELQQLTPEVLAAGYTVFELSPVKHNPNWGSSWSKWLEPQEPTVQIPVFSNAAQNAEISILTADSTQLKTWSVTLEKGLQYLPYQLDMDQNQPKDQEAAKNGKYYLQPGEYRVVVRVGKAEQEVVFKVLGS